MAIVVGPRHVMTCCHVLNVALGRPNRLDRTQPPPDSRFEVRFPFVTSEQGTGIVVGWGLSLKPARDVAILHLVDRDAPADAGVTEFSYGAAPLDKKWLCNGWDAAGAERGAGGTFGPLLSSGDLQLNSLSGVAHRIVEGYSGAGVWSDDLNAFMGMVVTKDRDHHENGLAYAIPTRVLSDVWPGVQKIRDERLSAADPIGTRMRESQSPEPDGQENVEWPPSQGIGEELSGKGCYLESLAAQLALFPWPRPHVAEAFFASLHIQVQVAPNRRSKVDKREDGPGGGIRAESEEAERRAYQSRADAKSFSHEGGKSPTPWATAQRGKSARYKYPWAVILADPGLGKTTLLRYEGWKTAQEQLDALRSSEIDVRGALIPIFIRQADLAGDSSSEEVEDVLLRFALEPSRVGRGGFSSAFRKYISKQIKAGQIVVLLDAQDEVTEKNYRTLNRRVQQILALRPQRIYFTSRHAGYRGNLLERGDQAVPELEIVAFTSEDIQRFIRAYFGGERGSGGQLLADGVWGALQRKPALMGLAQTPLLITMLCVAVWERRRASRPELPLPARRGDLYAECLYGLLGGWSMYRDGGLASPSVKGEIVEARVVPRRRLLAKMAWELAGHKLENTLFSRREVIACLNDNADLMREAGCKGARKALDVLSRRNGVLASEGDSYLFLHLTFQEYLVAWHLAQLFNEAGWDKALVTVKQRGKSQNVAAYRVLDRMSWLPRWQEVVPLLVGEMDDPLPLLELLSDETKDDLYRHRLALAARSLGEIRVLVDETDPTTY